MRLTGFSESCAVHNIAGRLMCVRSRSHACDGSAHHAALTEHTLIEARPAGPFGRLDDDGIIRNTVMITSRSSNGKGGRRYSDKALQSIARMSEGLPAYANHVAPDVAFKPRDVRDLIGRHQNVRVVKFGDGTSKVLSDLHVLEHHRPWVMALAQSLPDVVGNSLVSKGSVKMEGDTEVVDDILQVRSADLVSDPASTNGLFESTGGRADVRTLAAAVPTARLMREYGLDFSPFTPLPPGTSEVEQNARALAETKAPRIDRGAVATLLERLDRIEPLPAGLHERLAQAFGR